MTIIFPLDTSFEYWLKEQRIHFQNSDQNILNDEIKFTIYILEHTLTLTYLFFDSSSQFDKNWDFNAIQTKGIMLWEDQWIHKKQIVGSRILNLLNRSTKIFARKTIVKKITQTDVDHFLDHNHLQGSTNAKIKYGLFCEGKLVSVATFTWARKFYVGDKVLLSFGLIRHCNLNQHCVVGGMSKLLNHFINAHKPDDIMTFVDLDWTEGLSYQQMGFKLIEKTNPETFYIERSSYRRYYPHHLQSNGLNPDEMIRIENSGNNKYKLFINSLK